MLSRLVAGAQSSMLGPLVVVILSVTASTLLAVTAAWRRGVSGAVISSGLNIVFAFPGILLAVLAAAVFGAGLPAAAIALSIAYLPDVTRVLRGAALKERNQPYVAVLEVQGASAAALCLRHVPPNIGPLIVAQATILLGHRWPVHRDRGDRGQRAGRAAVRAGPGGPGMSNPAVAGTLTSAGRQLACRCSRWPA